MISVLCPTRLRLDKLTRSLTDLHRQAYDDIEILIAVDPDDPSDYSRLPPWLRVQILTAPERWGYRELHRYYNALARHATGEWLLLWNDDAEMTTAGWDLAIDRFEPDIVLSPDNPHRPIPAFPIVPHRFVGALGHFSLGPHNDIWWQDIANALGILEWIDVRVEHHRPDLDGSQPDTVHQERGHWLQQQYDELGEELQHDIETIRALLSRP